jgi:hypothetical protein
MEMNAQHNHKRMKLVFTFALVSLLLLSSVSAVGIKWYTEQESVSENSEKCIPYGAYNPSSRDIGVHIEVTGNIQEIITTSAVTDELVPAKTSSANAKEINFCFTMPKIYQDDCLVGNLICEQTCQSPAQSFTGDVVMTETMIGNAGGTAGSGTTIAASAPLTLTALCQEKSRDWSIAYLSAILVCAIVFMSALYIKYRKPKIERDKEKLQKLQARIKAASK